MMQLLVIGIMAFVLFTVQNQIYRRFWKKNLKASIEFTSKGIFEGNEGTIKEVIENRKRLPLTMLKVKFQTDRHLIFSDDKGSRTTDQYYRNDVFQVNGGERITRTISFVAGRRGYYRINNIDLIGTDFLMSTEMGDSVSASTELYVYPRPISSYDFLKSLKNLSGEVLTKRHLIEDPFEYRGIREYQPYDDMRSINWKATAKTDELKINQKNYSSIKAIRIFINLEDTGVLRRENAVESCMRIASTLADHFIKEGFQVALYCNGRNILDGRATIINASGGPGQMEAILKAFALVDTSKKVYSFNDLFKDSLFSEAKNTVNFVISPNNYEDFENTLSEFVEAGNDLLWYYPTEEKKEPEVPELLRKHLKTIYIKN